VAFVIVNGERYEEPDNVTLGEARDVKRISGMAIPEWGDKLKDGDPDAVAALLYVVMRRKNPAITEDDINALDAAAIGGTEDDGPPEADGDSS